MDPTKIHPLLLEELSMSFGTQSEEERPRSVEDDEEFPIIVRLYPRRNLDTMLILGTDREMLRVERSIEMMSTVTGRATRLEILALSNSSSVEMIWYDEPVYALIDHSLTLTEVPLVWQTGNEGEGVKICIVDTGIDAGHPDFAGRLLAQEDFTGEGLGDRHGHGTHVASIAAGSGEASGGQYRGVAPRATLLAAKVLRGDGTGRMSMVMAGVEWAVDQGAQIINLSLGTRGNCDGSDATSTVCDMAMSAGAVVIVAAGNEGPGSGTLGSPGCARRPITVGAMTDDYRIADFSSRGPTLDGRSKPDIVLPGQDIVAARATATSLGRPVNEHYTSMNGTSMAAPHAAGIAALMLAANPSLKPTTIKEIMMTAVRSLDVDEMMQGKGLLLATRALVMAQGQPPAPEPTPSPVPPEPSIPPTEGRDGCSPLARLLGRRAE
ncbi:MAG: S8 family peptidase [Ardenticatenales bacterium]|nr:S8 family peptidase [Ardenticatenales bacterium]